jgi:hypothetical protein
MVELNHAKHSVMALEHLPYFPDLSSRVFFFLFLQLKSVPKQQSFKSAREVTAKAMSALSVIEK